MSDEIRKEELKDAIDEKMASLTPEEMENISGGAGEGYTCKYCGKTFMTITSIAAHVSSVHRQ